MKLFKTLLIYKLSFLIVFSLLAPAAAFAQRRKAASTKSKSTVAKKEAETEEPAQTCDGWRGTITYLEKEEDESFKQNGANGYEKRQTKRVKEGSLVLDGARKGQSKLSLETFNLSEEESKSTGCCYLTLAGCNKESTLIRRSKVTWEDTAKGEDYSTSVNVEYNGSKYTIKFDFPAMKGKLVMRNSGGTTGYCDPKLDEEGSQENTNPDVNHPYTPVKVEGTVDPKNPSVLKGSMQPDKNTMIVWELTRAKGDCDEGELNVAGLKLEQHVYPNPTAWQEIGENTVDGNQVKITAAVSNSSKKSKSGTVTFKETTSGEVLGTQTVSVAGGAESEVAINWDTNGYAWTDAGEKMSNRRIEASLSNGETAEAEVVVYPKPVILVHGLWSNGAAWADYHNYLEEAHSYAWKAYAVGANPKIAQMNTGNSAGNMEPTFSIRQNAQELGKQIAHTQKTENAWRVDVVAHSMGGLITRFYIHNTMTNAPDGKPTIAHLVMLGTPNMGSPCADLMYPSYKALGFEVEALRQLQPDVVAEFNSRTTNRKGVKFSILAGFPVPRTCQKKSLGDGVVEIPSALWQVADRSFAPRAHTFLTGREDFLAFVKPRLALGPRKSKQTASVEKKSNGEFYAQNNSSISENLIASLNPPAVLSNLRNVGNTTQIVSSKAVKIAAGESAEVPVNFANAQSGVSFVAPPSVKVSLIKPDGEIEQTIEAESPEALQTFKTFYAANVGNQILRFENTGEANANAVITVWNENNPLALEFVEIQKQTDGGVKMQAALTNNGTPVKGAVVSVKINNQIPEIALIDDGKHGDGAAGDGVYGGTTGKLSAGEQFIEAKAAASGLQATATTVLTIREANQ